MANHKATQKDSRQSAKRRERNRYVGKTTRNAIKELLKETVSKTEYDSSLPKVISMVDKLAKKGIIHKNKAAHLKSKLSKISTKKLTTEKKPITKKKSIAKNKAQ